MPTPTSSKTPTKRDRSAYNKQYRAANKERLDAKAKAYRDQNKDARHNYDLVRAYGITAEQYAGLLHRQGGRCAMCGTSAAGCRGKGRLHVDHCHDKGHVRGLLCHACNTGIGLLKHDIALLDRAKAYLKAEPCSLN
ncbi:endonuclease VII domain-containing protein [Bradyrhizobium japonicum]|uniref:endonuclease VII domain-containing protein n=1 Tax=Bradyrhizobium japonicum TaxID=375 RepID=UPI0035A09A74